jgi:Uma2 family endonuclease
MTAATRAKTFSELYREIDALPEGQRGEILVPGEIHVTMGRPGKAHRHAAKLIDHDLRDDDVRTGGTGWLIELEPEVRFGERLYDPDLAGWRVEHVAELPDENPIDLRPDWVCEIFSPSTHVTDIRKKLPIYAKEGVPFIWFVDPEARLVEVFVPDAVGRASLLATASEEEAIVLPPFEHEVHPLRWWVKGT